MGKKVTKIHSIWRFTQSLWVEKYIEHNTQKRTVAMSAFKKHLYKQINTSYFEKTIQQVEDNNDKAEEINR